MPGRPRTMAKRLEQLLERQMAIYEGLEALIPKQYRNRPPSDDEDFVPFSWRRASHQLYDAAHDGLPDLLYVYEEKAKKAEQRARRAEATRPIGESGDDGR